jgi:hypothetical protein
MENCSFQLLSEMLKYHTKTRTLNEFVSRVAVAFSKAPPSTAHKMVMECPLFGRRFLRELLGTLHAFSTVQQVQALNDDMSSHCLETYGRYQQRCQRPAVGTDLDQLASSFSAMTRFYSVIVDTFRSRAELAEMDPLSSRIRERKAKRSNSLSSQIVAAAEIRWLRVIGESSAPSDNVERLRSFVEIEWFENQSVLGELVLEAVRAFPMSSYYIDMHSQGYDFTSIKRTQPIVCSTIYDSKPVRGHDMEWSVE